MGIIGLRVFMALRLGRRDLASWALEHVALHQRVQKTEGYMGILM